MTGSVRVCYRWQSTIVSVYNCIYYTEHFAARLRLTLRTTLEGRLERPTRNTTSTHSNDELITAVRFLRPSDSGGWPIVEAVVYSTGLPFL